MDSKRNTSNIKYSTFDILKKTNYIVTCSFSNNDHLVIKSFDDKVFTIKYSNGELVFNYRKSISCSPIEAYCLVPLIVRDICEALDYPFKYLDYFINGKRTDSFYFDLEEISDDSLDRINDIYQLCLEIYNYGLTRERLIEATELNALKEIYRVCEYIYMIKIDIKDNDVIN